MASRQSSATRHEYDSDYHPEETLIIPETPTSPMRPENLLKRLRDAADIISLVSPDAPAVASAPKRRRLTPVLIQNPKDLKQKAYSCALTIWDTSGMGIPVATRDPEGVLDFIKSRFPSIKYAIVGDERGEEQGGSHYQCYIQFNNQRFLTAVRDIFTGSGVAPHIEKAMGTPLHNRTYCSKEGRFAEFGVIPDGHHTARGRLVGMAEDLVGFIDKTDETSQICREEIGRCMIECIRNIINA